MILINKNNKGFSLSEVLIAVAIMTVVMGAAYSLLSHQVKESQLLTQKLELIEFSNELKDLLKKPEACLSYFTPLAANINWATNSPQNIDITNTVNFYVDFDKTPPSIPILKKDQVGYPKITGLIPQKIELTQWQKVTTVTTDYFYTASLKIEIQSPNGQIRPIIIDQLNFEFDPTPTGTNRKIAQCQRGELSYRRWARFPKNRKQDDSTTECRAETDGLGTPTISKKIGSHYINAKQGEELALGCLATPNGVVDLSKNSSYPWIKK